MEVAIAVAILSILCIFEGFAGQEVVTSPVTSTTPVKKNEFANNLSQCVAIKPIDSCLFDTLEDLRSFMPIGIPELNLRPSEPLKIENIQFKTRPGIGVQIESEFSNVSLVMKNWKCKMGFPMSKNWFFAHTAARLAL